MKTHLNEIIRLFFKLGVFAFGGPAAHIAMMHDEVVSRRKWMTDEHFLDLVGATNLIPGPNSTEMAIHCGLDRGGWRGLVASGLSFILPAAVMTGILAWIYVTYQHVPELAGLLYGIKPAVLAIIVRAVYMLGKKALKSWQLGVVGAAVVGVAFAGLSEIWAILLGGAFGALWLLLQSRISGGGTAAGGAAGLLMLCAPNPALHAALQSAALAPPTITLSKIFLTFLKIGSVLFGSGYVLVAYLDGELVKQLAWLTEAQLLDAIAIGQFTPGPVLTTATFVGFQLAGWQGAVLATVGIFLPSFLFVALLNPLIPKLRNSKIASAFLDAVNISAMAVMLVVALRLAAGVLVDWPAMAIAALAAFFTFGKIKIGSGWLIAGGALLGILIKLIMPGV